MFAATERNITACVMKGVIKTVDCIKEADYVTVSSPIGFWTWFITSEWDGVRPEGGAAVSVVATYQSHSSPALWSRLLFHQFYF